MKLRLAFSLLFILVLISGFVSACNPSNQLDESDPTASAKKALLDFYSLLNEGEFEQASALYGGSYEVLQGYNPGLDQDDHAGLLQMGCDANGLMCLEVLDFISVQTGDEGEYIFEISLANPDGSQFVLGPCCGATEEEMPSQTSFSMRVVCEDDNGCLVMDLPPYMP